MQIPVTIGCADLRWHTNAHTLSEGLNENNIYLLLAAFDDGFNLTKNLNWVLRIALLFALFDGFQ